MNQFRLAPGERFYAGYHEWLVHPFEAREIVRRGYVTINGCDLSAEQVDVVAGYPLIRVTELRDFGAESDPQCPAIDNLPGSGFGERSSADLGFDRTDLESEAA